MVWDECEARRLSEDKTADYSQYFPICPHQQRTQRATRARSRWRGRLTGERRSTVPPRNTDVCRGDQCRWTQQGQGPFGGWETPCLPAQAAGAATTASQAAAPPLFLSPDSKPTLGNQQQKTIP